MAFQDRSLKNRIAPLFNNKQYADIYFNVEGLSIPGHKMVICTASRVLEELCSGGVEEVFLDGTTIPIFSTLLRYLYTDKVTITADNVYELMVAAKTYGVPSLEGLCVNHRIKQLNPSNAFMILLQARQFGQEELIKASLKIIDDQTVEAVESEGFLEIDKATLMTVLSRDTLYIKEIELFSALLRWTDAECIRKKLPSSSKIRQEILYDIIHLIRFPLMTLDEFTNTVLPSSVLCHEDASALFSHLCGNGRVSNFNATLRRSPGYTFVINRFQSVGSKWTYFGGYDKIAFTVDRDVHLMGIGLYAIRETWHNYTFTVNVYENSDDLLYRSTIKSVKCKREDDIFHFYFTRPVKIRRNVDITISLKIKEGPASLCGCDGLKEIRQALPGGESVTVRFFKATENSSKPLKTVRTNVTTGQIPSLIFSL